MTERPILFSGAMVRALQAGIKTQTRRALKPQPSEFVGGPGVTLRDGSPAPLIALDDSVEPYGREIACPYGQPGDRLWVRETFYAWGRWETRFSAKKRRDEWHFEDLTLESGKCYSYSADGDGPMFERGKRNAGVLPGWWKRPAIFMPRAASRITLEITSMRVERLQDISVAAAIAEGCPGGEHGDRYAALEQYRALWESINGPGSWDANPWVWVVEFRRLP